MGGLDLLVPIDVVEKAEEDGSMHKVGAFLVGRLSFIFVSVLCCVCCGTLSR